MGSPEGLGATRPTVASDPQHRSASSAACLRAGMCSQCPYPPHLTPGTGQGMSEMGLGCFIFFMHKLSTCCFLRRSRQQRVTSRCHCSGSAGPPDFPPPSRLPPPPLPQAPTRPGEKPSSAMLGRSAFPQAVSRLTYTGCRACSWDPALPSHPGAGCVLPSPGCSRGREG